MTSLEIKRLDSQLPPKSNASSNSNHMQSNNNDPIPINIIKSPSYNAITSASKTSQSKLAYSDAPHNNSNNSSPVKSPSGMLTNGSINKHTTPTSATATITAINMRKSPQASNHTIVSNNEDVDSVLNANNNASLLPNANNTGTLTFNKYGFLQANDTSASSKTNTINRNSTLSKSKSKRGDGDSPNAKNDDDNNGGGDANNRRNDDDSFNTSDAEANRTVTNLKDYIQNTDVEEFSEHLPIEVIRNRETKWIEMLKNFDEWMEKRFKKIKSRCRKGIPQSMRSTAWMHLTGAIVQKKKMPNYYNDCLHNVRQVEISKYIEDIKKDLHRQFPGHEIFMKKEGRQMLFNVLKAYAVHNKEVGYCQAQGPIAAVLLMHMPEEDAFWMLIKISDFYLKEYFKPGLEKVQIDGQALFYLFKRENAAVHKLIKSQGIDPILYMTEWFMCLYSRTLPWCTILRVWDMFFCEGVKVLYRVGLFLMRSAFDDKQKFQRCVQNGMYETMNQLKNLPVEYLNESRLVKESSLIKISEDDLTRAFKKSKIEFQKQMNEMQRNRKQPPSQSSYTNKQQSNSANSKKK